MFFEQKIYFNDKPLILTNDRQHVINNNPIAAGYAVFQGAFPGSFRLATEHLQKLRSPGAIIEDISEKSLKEELHSLYEPVEAGGGVVYNEYGEILMIYRRGKWDLPKGKKDEGETIEICALREVKEETGLNELDISEKICDGFHIYSQNGHSFLKHTSWFRMKGNGKEMLTPQKEESISEACWIAEKSLAPYVHKSYKAIGEVLEAAGLKWS